MKAARSGFRRPNAARPTPTVSTATVPTKLNRMIPPARRAIGRHASSRGGSGHHDAAQGAEAFRDEIRVSTISAVGLEQGRVMERAESGKRQRGIVNRSVGGEKHLPCGRWKETPAD